MAIEPTCLKNSTDTEVLGEILGGNYIRAFSPIMTRANLANRPGPDLIEEAAFHGRQSRRPVC